MLNYVLQSGAQQPATVSVVASAKNAHEVDITPTWMVAALQSYLAPRFPLEKGKVETLEEHMVAGPRRGLPPSRSSMRRRSACIRNSAGLGPGAG